MLSTLPRRGSTLLHDVFHGQSYDEVDENQANQSIQGLFTSLFFLQDDPATIVAQGCHTPINCFFLATNLKKGGQFKSALTLPPQLNHIHYILQLVACKELANSMER